MVGQTSRRLLPSNVPGYGYEMALLRFKVVSDSQFDIVGRDEEKLATVERGENNLWRIIAERSNALPDGLNSGPFDTSEAAFEELGAVDADQS